MSMFQNAVVEWGMNSTFFRILSSTGTSKIKNAESRVASALSCLMSIDRGGKPSEEQLTNDDANDLILFCSSVET